MKLDRFNKIKVSLISFAIVLLVGVLSAVRPEFLVVLIGVIVYVSLVILFTNENNIKKVLPPFFVIILFQDTIIRNVELYSNNLGTLISYIDEGVLLIWLTSFIVRLFRGKLLNGKSILFILIIILTLGFISCLINDVPFNIAIPGAFLFVKGLLYLCLFANISFNESDIKRYVKSIKIVSIIVLLFAIVDLVFWQQLRTLLHTDYKIEFRAGVINLQSLFIHPGIYGWFMVFIGTYTIAATKVKMQYKYLNATVVFFSFALLSFRFKAMLGIISILFFLYLLNGTKKVIAFSIPFVMILLVGWLIAGNYIAELTEMTLQRYVFVDMYDSARNALYQVSILIGKNEFPFGAGFGRYGSFTARSQYSPVYYEYGMDTIWGLTPDKPDFATDTYWPSVIGEIGFIGMFVMAMLFVYLAIKLLKKFKSVEKQNLQSFILFAGFTFVYSMIESLGEPIYNSAPQNVFIFITVGIAWSLLNHSKVITHNHQTVKD